MIASIIIDANICSTHDIRAAAENLVSGIAQVTLKPDVDRIREVDSAAYVEVAIAVKVYIRGAGYQRILPDGNPIEALN